MFNQFNGIAEDARSTIFPLIEGIVEEAQTLFRQEVALARSEIRQEVQKARTVALTFGAAVFVSFLAGVLGCLAIAYLLVWFFPNLPLWACFGLTFCMLGVVAIGLFIESKRSRAKLNMLPRQAFQSLKETTEWATRKI